MITIDIPMPKCCDECFALDDHGDYPFCLISQDQRGYTFNTRKNRMPTCPLKAFEPRVMTLEEVENAIDTVVWVDRPTEKNESKLFGLIQAYSRKFKFIQIKHIEMNMGEHMLYPYETYGKEWRCWTSRPTDEQRERQKYGTGEKLRKED